MFSFQRFWAIARKELLVLFFNKVSRILIVVPPLAQIVIFGWAATLEVRNETFAVLDRDRGIWSERVTNAVLGSPTFVRVIRLANEEEMRRVMDRGDALFTLVFDERFSRNLAASRSADMQMILDGRRANSAQLACYYVTRIVDSVTGTALPVSTVTRSWFNPNLDFQWYFLPNLIGILTFMLGLVVTGLTIAREREVGTFDQLLVTPSTPAEMALAKLVPGCVTGLVHGTIFLAVTVLGFGVPFTGQFALLYVSLFVFAVASGALGLMISSLCQTQQQAFLGAFTIGVPSILISGVLTPVNNMPPILQILSEAVPMTHFAVLCQGVFLRDIPLEAALAGLGKITLTAVVCVIISIWLFKRRT